jgi:molecular chaperone DnaJ
VLGIGKDATKADIKKAYFALAKKYHPDINKEKDAPTKFSEATTAYDVLGDDAKRKAYDQFGHAAEETSGGDPQAHQAHQEQVLREFLRQMGMDGFNFRGGFPGMGGMGGMRREPRGPERGNDIVVRIVLSFSIFLVDFITLCYDYYRLVYHYHLQMQ